MITYLGNVYQWRPSGVRGLTMDGTGLFGTGILGGDMTTWDGWDWGALVVIGLAAWAVVNRVVYGAKHIPLEAELAASKRRKSRAAAMRAKAKKLEAQTTGFGGLFF